VKVGLDPELPEKIAYLARQLPELRRRGYARAAIRNTARSSRRDLAAGLYMQAGRAAGGEPGWRAAVGYEIISRLGWRGEHGYTADWNRLAAQSRAFLAAAAGATP
jgi:hypothetical protein